MVNTTIPLGYRFLPTEEQLITLFLEKKVTGTLNCGDYPILDRALYGDNATPWNVLKEVDPWEDSEIPNKKVVYVFTRLIFVSGNTKNRVVRTAGCGTWGGKAVTQDIKNSRGELIGHKKAFTFKPQKGYESEMTGKGRWIMHEYSLVAGRGNQSSSDHVICRISKDLPKEVTLSKDHESQTTMDRVTCIDSTSSSDSTAETNRKRKYSSGDSCENDHLTQKKVCSGVLEDQSSNDTMQYLYASNGENEVIPYNSNESWDWSEICKTLHIDEQQWQQLHFMQEGNQIV